MALAVTTRSHLSVLRALVALAAVVLYFSGAVADARVLLTLDDFGAVGDGIANDTQVQAVHAYPDRSVIIAY